MPENVTGFQPAENIKNQYISNSYQHLTHAFINLFPRRAIFELVRKTSSENLKVALNVLIVTAQEIFDKWLALASTNELYWVRATIINRETEYWAKIEYQFHRLHQHGNELGADRRIDDLPWPKIDFNLLEESKARRRNFLLKLMAEEATRLGALTRPNSYPDFAGQFLHAVGEKLLASLISNDAEIVDESFGYFFASSLMQYDQLRAKANFEDWRGLTAIKVAKIMSRGFGSRVLSYSYFLFVWIGVGYCIFRGAEATLQWMPRNWINVSEDGDATWMGYSFAGLAGFAGSLWVVEKMGKLAQRLDKAERDCSDR